MMVNEQKRKYTCLHIVFEREYNNHHHVVYFLLFFGIPFCTRVECGMRLLTHFQTVELTQCGLAQDAQCTLEFDCALKKMMMTMLRMQAHFNMTS